MPDTDSALAQFDAERAKRAIEALRTPDASLARVPNTIRQSIAEVIEGTCKQVDRYGLALMFIREGAECPKKIAGDALAGRTLPAPAAHAFLSEHLKVWLHEAEYVSSLPHNRLNLLREAIAVLSTPAAPKERCAECDNGVLPTWDFCPFCATPRDPAAQTPAAPVDGERERLAKIMDSDSTAKTRDADEETSQSRARFARKCAADYSAIAALLRLPREREGWPTDEMIEAGEEHLRSLRQHGMTIFAGDLFNAMLAAAPSSPSKETTDDR